MSNESNLKSRAWLIEILKRSQALSEDVYSKLDSFRTGKEDLGVEELGLDSLALMQLSIDIEDEVGIQISIENFGKARTLAELLDILNSGISESGLG
jgi:acyl carrier protein